MVNQNQAIAIIKRNLPDGKIQKMIQYQDLFVFQVFTSDPLEGAYDPFYQVDMKTGKFKGFPLLTSDVKTVDSLFQKAPKL